MKSNVPWSIKGIDPESRVIAKRAAAEAGMTLGEWLNNQIKQLEEGDPDHGQNNPPQQEDTRADDEPPSLPANLVTIDQFREIVYSLNRMNERLKAAESTSREAFSGLNQGLVTIMDRVRKVESTTGGRIDPELRARIERLSQQENDSSHIESLVSLEKNLTEMLEQFDANQKDTLQRIEANEDAISDLDLKVAQIDTRSAAALAQLRDQADAVTDQIKQTEKMARAVILEARAAAGTSDEEFIERTTNKLRILGTEIKRSGTQIQALETEIQKLNSKIEGAEQRSAEGINRLSGAIQSLQTNLSEFDKSQAEATRHAQNAISQSTEQAQSRIDDLQNSFDRMLTQIEQTTVSTAQAPSTHSAPLKSLEQPSISTALEDNIPDEEDFDEIFGNALEPPFEDEIGPAPHQGNSDGADEDPFADRSVREPDAEEPPRGDNAASGRPALTAKQKVILAARARRKRMEREAQQLAAAVSRETPEQQQQFEAPSEELEYVASYQPEPEPGLTRNSKLSALKEKYNSGGDSSVLPKLLIIIAAALAVLVLSFLLLTRGDPQRVANDPQPVTSTAGRVEPVNTPASALPATPTPREELLSWQQLAQTAVTPEERARAISVLTSSANKGYAPAQYTLGENYRTGGFIPENQTTARRWMETAAENGNVAAMHRLGSMMVNGIGGAQDVNTGIVWFERAATFGYVDSVYNLGLLFDPFVDVPGISDEAKNPDLAYYWYSLAARLGDADASAEVAELAKDINPDSRARIDQDVAAWTQRQPSLSAN